MENKNQVMWRAKQASVRANLMRLAEKKFGFRFAGELHQAMLHGMPGHRAMLRKVLAK